MFDRALAAAVIALLTAAPVPLAHADPPPCPASGCPHGTGSVPPPVNVNSPSYKDGYKTEHDYFSNPQNHAYLASEMKAGYTTALACQVEVGGGPPPANLNEWIAGCADALRDLGFKP